MHHTTPGQTGNRRNREPPTKRGKPKPAPEFVVRKPRDGESCLSLQEPGVVTVDSLCLPHEVMRRAGAAAQTFGALLRLTRDGRRTCYFRLEKIADVACLPTATVRRHLVALNQDNLGLVVALGREKLPGGAKLRRTATYYIDPKQLDEYKSPFAMLPRWAARAGTTWSVRAVFALLASRHSLIDWIEQQGCGENRFAYSLTDLCRDSGLAREAAVRGKRALEAAGAIEVGSGRCMDRTSADEIVLSNRFFVPVGLLDQRFWDATQAPDEDVHADGWMRFEMALTKSEIAKAAAVVAHCQKLGLTPEQAFHCGKFLSGKGDKPLRGGLLYHAFMELTKEKTPYILKANVA